MVRSISVFMATVVLLTLLCSGGVVLAAAGGSADPVYYSLTVDDLMGYNHWSAQKLIEYKNAGIGVRFTWNDTGVNVRQAVNRPLFMDGIHMVFDNLTVQDGKNARLALYLADLDKAEQYSQYNHDIKYYPFTLAIDFKEGKVLLANANGSEQTLIASEKLKAAALSGKEWAVKINRVRFADNNSDWQVSVAGETGTFSKEYFKQLTHFTNENEVYLTLSVWKYANSFSVDLKSLHGGANVCADEISTDERKKLDETVDAIAAIGTVTPDSGKAIKAAEQAYASLPFSLQQLVGNFQTLEHAKAIYKAVRAIADIGTVSKSSGAAIAAAEQALLACSTEERMGITNYAVLVAAQKRYYALVNGIPTDKVASFSGVVGVYNGKSQSNAALVPAYKPDSEVKMEDSGFGIVSPEWVKTLTIVEMNPYYALDSAYMGTDIQKDWDGRSPGLFESDRALQMLDHLAETGVNGIWFTPINDRGDTGNGYGNFGMHTIDPLLTGTRDYEAGWAVFKKFVDEAHKRNIRVFIDAITWGTVKEAPLYKEHPAWYAGREAWGGWAWNWSNQGLREWYIKTCIDVAVKSGIDGWRCDCEPGTTGYEIYAAIREGLLEKGRKVATFSENGNDALGNAYDFGEHMLDWDDVNEWTANTMFHDGRFNLVDAVKSPTDTPVIGTQTAQSMGEAAANRFYGGLITCHDYERYAVKGRTLYAGYQSLFAPFIPIWYLGEEWNNPHGQRWESMYVEVISWDTLDDEANSRFHEQFKAMVRIRRTYTDLFQYFPEHLYDTNMCKVDTFGGEWLQAYARYANGRAAIVVGNNNAQSTSDAFTVVVPFKDAGIIGDDKTVYTVTELMSGKTIRGTKAQIGVFSATVPQNTVAVFLVEATENIPVTEAPSVTEPDTVAPSTEAPSVTEPDTVAPSTEAPVVTEPDTDGKNEPSAGVPVWIWIAGGVVVLSACVGVIVWLAVRKRGK